MPTPVRAAPKPVPLPWPDDDGYVATSYRGGGRDAAIKANLNSAADALAMAVGLEPGERFLDKPSFSYRSTIVSQARAGYRIGSSAGSTAQGISGAVFRGTIYGVGKTVAGMLFAPFSLAKNTLDLAGHSVAKLLGK